LMLLTSWGALLDLTTLLKYLRYVPKYHWMHVYCIKEDWPVAGAPKRRREPWTFPTASKCPDPLVSYLQLTMKHKWVCFKSFSDFLPATV
jgi:hypothetical protein